MPRKPFTKGMKRLPGAGRKKGTPNKFTTAKQAFLTAFEELGGEEFIKRVARDGAKGRQCVLNNMAKLLPNKQEVSGPDGGPIKTSVNVTVRLVPAKKEIE